MKNNRKSRSPKNWRDKFKEKLKEDHLRILEEAVEHDGGLFRDTKEYEEYRKHNVRYRIEKLLENDRNIDALAWLCLETELNPDNVEAIAMKEQLKKKLYFTKEDRIEIKNSNKIPLFDWGPVAGMQDEKKFIERNILLPLKEKKIYKNFKVSIPKGIILHGPPGCGKTFIVRQMARLLKFSFFELTPSSIASTYVHGTQEKIESSFA